jgi:hypothetical protein
LGKEEGGEALGLVDGEEISRHTNNKGMLNIPTDNSEKDEKAELKRDKGI